MEAILASWPEAHAWVHQHQALAMMGGGMFLGAVVLAVLALFPGDATEPLEPSSNFGGDLRKEIADDQRRAARAARRAEKQARRTQATAAEAEPAGAATASAATTQDPTAASLRKRASAASGEGGADPSPATGKLASRASTTRKAAEDPAAAVSSDSDSDDDPFDLPEEQRARLKATLHLTDDQLDLAISRARRGEEAPSIRDKARWVDRTFYLLAFGAIGYFAWRDYGINIISSIASLFPRESDVIVNVLQRLHA